MATGSTTTTTYRVAVQFAPESACAREELEERAALVSDALDEHTSDAVTGSLVSVRFDPPALEVEFLVVAVSPPELHRHIAEVLQVLEDHADLEHELAGGGYAESARVERDLVAA